MVRSRVDGESFRVQTDYHHAVGFPTTMQAVFVTSPDSPTSLDVARVICPYTGGGLRPEVVWALQDSGHDFEAVDVSGSDESYHELLSDLWGAGKSFALVEHDVVIGPDTLASFDSCPMEWCTFSYRYLSSVYWGLGCTRFRGSLLQRLPDVMVQVAEYGSPRHPKRHWCIQDQAITTALRSRRLEWPHLHGEVEHLSDGWPSHGCRPHPVGS